MKEPHVRADPIRHVCRLRCTTEDLMILAEIARAHKTAEAHVPFWRVDLGEVEVRFCLDKDREISERAKARSE